MVEQQKQMPLNQRDGGRVNALDEAALAAVRTVEPAPERDDAEEVARQAMA
jgi:hypothetical protein